MATITHGPKDGVDELLEKISSLDRILRNLGEVAATEERKAAFDKSRSFTSQLREVATELRGQVDLALKTTNVPS